MFHNSLITALNEEFIDEIQRATLYVLLTMLLSILHLMKGLCVYFSCFSPQQQLSKLHMPFIEGHDFHH